MTHDANQSGYQSPPRRQVISDLLAAVGLSRVPDSGATAVLWVYRDYSGRWRVRQEGGEVETSLDSRGEAAALARALGQARGSYCIFLALKDGRVTEETLRPVKS